MTPGARSAGTVTSPPLSSPPALCHVSCCPLGTEGFPGKWAHLVFKRHNSWKVLCDGLGWGRRSPVIGDRPLGHQHRDIGAGSRQGPWGPCHLETSANWQSAFAIFPPVRPRCGSAGPRCWLGQETWGPQGEPDHLATAPPGFAGVLLSFLSGLICSSLCCCSAWCGSLQYPCPCSPPSLCPEERGARWASGSFGWCLLAGWGAGIFATGNQVWGMRAPSEAPGEGPSCLPQLLDSTTLVNASDFMWPSSVFSSACLL